MHRGTFNLQERTNDFQTIKNTNLWINNQCGEYKSFFSLY